MAIFFDVKEQLIIMPSIEKSGRASKHCERTNAMPVSMYVRTSSTGAVNNSNEQNLMSPDFYSGTRTFAANTLLKGKVIIVRAWGVILCTPTNPGTLRMKLKLQGTTISDTGAMTLTQREAGWFWEYYHMITVRVDGDEGRIQVNGSFSFIEASAMNRPVAGGLPIAIDTTQAATMEMTGQFSVAAAGIGISCDQLMVELFEVPVEEIEP